MPGYFSALHIPALSGRDFTDFDRENTKQVAVINKAMADLVWPGQDPLGKRFTIVVDPHQYEVIGVVGTTIIGAVGEDPQPVAYFPLRQQYSPVASLLVRTTGNPEALMGAVRAQVNQIDRNLALTNGQTVGQLLAQGLWASRMGAALLGLFGVLALVLASVGIYGVLSYSVTQRTSEIGIRMALGAQSRQVLKLVLRQGMLLAGVGVLAGVAIALPITSFASSLLYGVSPSDPLTYIVIAVVLLAVALLACYVPARRATRIDPLVALRFE
jgi:putative ABC transport system permease protein